jgi:hypothetical protein
MKLGMAPDTEYHCVPISFNHPTFPGRFALEISQFSYVVYFHLPTTYPAPFAWVGKQTFPQLGTTAAHAHPREEDFETPASRAVQQGRVGVPRERKGHSVPKSDA